MIRYFIFLFAGIVGSLIARRNGRNPIMWFIICALLPFLIIVVALLPAMVSKGYTKKCCYCAEIIKENAMVCKHCGREQPIEGTYVDADFTETS